MDKYKCHKVVEAMKIAQIKLDECGSGSLSDGNGEEYWCEPIWMEMHKPEVGGYYVQYADNYRSYSPAKAFEEGYTLLREGDEGEAAMGAMAAGLLTLLDRIETENDPSLAGQRFEIAEAVGLKVSFHNETSARSN
jgi:hypothetical protein